VRKKEEKKEKLRELRREKLKAKTTFGGKCCEFCKANKASLSILHLTTLALKPTSNALLSFLRLQMPCCIDGSY
jgi:hypothetical protein